MDFISQLICGKLILYEMKSNRQQLSTNCLPQKQHGLRIEARLGDTGCIDHILVDILKLDVFVKNSG